MIVLKPQTVLQRIAEVLEQTVLSDLQSSHAKGQAHAAVAMLRDVMSLWSDFTGIYIADNQGLVRLLRRYLKLEPFATDSGGMGQALTVRIRETLDHLNLKATDYQTARDTNLKLRGLVDQLLIVLDGQPDHRQARSLRRAVRKHLKAALLRELGSESQSALGKMSRGD